MIGRHKCDFPGCWAESEGIMQLIHLQTGETLFRQTCGEHLDRITDKIDQVEKEDGFRA